MKKAKNGGMKVALMTRTTPSGRKECYKGGRESSRRSGQGNYPKTEAPFKEEESLCDSILTPRSRRNPADSLQNITQKKKKGNGKFKEETRYYLGSENHSEDPHRGVGVGNSIRLGTLALGGGWSKAKGPRVLCGGVVRRWKNEKRSLHLEGKLLEGKESWD